MHVLYRFKDQGVILEQEVWTTTPIQIKSLLESRIKPPHPPKKNAYES